MARRARDRLEHRPPCRPPPGPAAPAAIISVGSTHSAYAAEPEWIARHTLLLPGALAADTPVLGVCFGAQALALAGGGEVALAARPELGWVEPQREQQELAGPWLSWHFDTITAPPAAAVPLARSPDALQAFRLGRSLGIQFPSGGHADDLELVDRLRSRGRPAPRRRSRAVRGEPRGARRRVTRACVRTARWWHRALAEA
ncbi:MAG: gamma-glutamyl-gamma-aminobutyrate hydrolase family protein [Actinomycetota bacterium]|nr:gamma-glutamyl-gamma-aminobutyrate hydrolase family protein [Actinomycetota bacterium]